VAPQTKHIRLGTGVLSLPYHNPLMTANRMAQLDHLTFGRTIFGAGPGLLVSDAHMLGLDARESRDKLDVGLSRISSPDDPATLSWLAIGQPAGSSTLVMTPLQMAMMIGAIGNGGTMQQAHIIDHLTNPIGMDYARLKIQASRSLVSADNAANLEKLLIEAVKNGTGSGAAIKGWTVAGKTGTVQVSGQKNNALFVGYIVESEMPLAIAVVVEEGGSGGRVAGPIASALLKEAAAVLSNKP